MKLNIYILILITVLIIIKISKKKSREDFSVNDVENLNIKDTCLTSFDTYINQISKHGKRCYNTTSSDRAVNTTTHCKSATDLSGFGQNLQRSMTEGKFIKSLTGNYNVQGESNYSRIGIANSADYPNKYAFMLDERSNIGINSVPDYNNSKKNEMINKLKIGVFLPTIRCKNPRQTNTNTCELELGEPVEVPLYYKDKPFGKSLYTPNDSGYELNYCNKDVIKCVGSSIDDICIFDLEDLVPEAERISIE